MLPDTPWFDSVAALVRPIPGGPPVLRDLTALNHTAVFVPAVRALHDVITIDSKVQQCDDLLAALGTVKDRLGLFVEGMLVSTHLPSSAIARLSLSQMVLDFSTTVSCL